MTPPSPQSQVQLNLTLAPECAILEPTSNESTKLHVNEPTVLTPMGSALCRSWANLMADELSQPYCARIGERLQAAHAAGHTTYPNTEHIFRAFNSTLPNAIKVVILGQDPYHQPHQAMGLSFSVPRGVTIPPSLRNVYKELVRSIPYYQMPSHGDLSHWATQGVFLLNSVLTVTESQAGSHAQWGWQQFTDAVISQLSQTRHGLVFMLWGNYAKQKASLIDAQRHLILNAIHPSPLGRGGFSGCNHFVLANDYLREQGEEEIDWQV